MNRLAMTILCPSLLMAALLESLLFSLVDPSDLRWPGRGPIDASPQAVCWLAFLVFWSVLAASGGLTALWWMRPDGADRDPTPA
jgi:hypothetical protein